MATATRERIITAASKLFYAEGLSRVSMDAVADKAGVTKRTLYYHFRSKDDLAAAYLSGRDQPNLALFAAWFAEAEGDAAAKIRAIFGKLAQSAQHPKWRGCGFLRTAAELVHMPGHPAMKVGIIHKRKLEAWLRDVLDAAGIENAQPLARQIRLLMDGSFAATLLDRDPSYMHTAGDAARDLVQAAMTRGA